MKLKQLRTSKKLTQQYMADFLNVTKTAYFNYEKGISEPNIQSLIKLADFFKISVDELINHNFATVYDSTDDELLKIVHQLNPIEKGKVIGYARSRVEAQSEIKDIKIRTGYRE